MIVFQIYYTIILGKIPLNSLPEGTLEGFFSTEDVVQVSLNDGSLFTLPDKNSPTVDFDGTARAKDNLDPLVPLPFPSGNRKMIY